MKIKLLITSIITLVSLQAALAFAPAKNENKIGKWYFSSMMDASTFTWANIKNVGICGPRYTAFINSGAHANYNIRKNIAVFTGLEARNLGFADVVNNKRIRHKSTYIGLPLGLRIGNLKEKTELRFGTGFDVAASYKYKEWTVGDKQDKIKPNVNASALRRFNPYVFAGYSFNNMGVKLQYYPKSFFAASNPVQVNLFYASVLFDASYLTKMLDNKKSKED